MIHPSCAAAGAVDVRGGVRGRSPGGRAAPRGWGGAPRPLPAGGHPRRAAWGLPATARRVGSPRGGGGAPGRSQAAPLHPPRPHRDPTPDGRSFGAAPAGPPPPAPAICAQKRTTRSRTGNAPPPNGACHGAACAAGMQFGGHPPQPGRLLPRAARGHAGCAARRPGRRASACAGGWGGWSVGSLNRRFVVAARSPARRHGPRGGGDRRADNHTRGGSGGCLHWPKCLDPPDPTVLQSTTGVKLSLGNYHNKYREIIETWPRAMITSSHLWKR